MIGEFLACHDCALGHNEHSSFANFDLAIRAAGVIDEARYIFLVPTVYRLCFGELEKVAVAAVKPFVSFEYGADIFNDACAFWDRLKRKQTATRTSALHSNTVSTWSEVRRRHEGSFYVGTTSLRGARSQGQVDDCYCLCNQRRDRRSEVTLKAGWCQPERNSWAPTDRPQMHHAAARATAQPVSVAVRSLRRSSRSSQLGFLRAARAFFRPVLRTARAVFRPVLRAARAVFRAVLRVARGVFRAVLRVARATLRPDVFLGAIGVSPILFQEEHSRIASHFSDCYRRTW